MMFGIRLLLATFALLMWSASSLVAAERLTIAVPEILPHARPYESETSPYMAFVASSSAPPLMLRAQEDFSRQGLTFRFVQRFEQHPQEELLKFWLGNGALLSNGHRIAPEDVLGSLKRCISGRKEFSNLTVEREASSPEVLQPLSQVAFLVKGDTARAMELLASCSVLQERTSEIFGDYLGQSNMYVGLGPYDITTMKPGVRVLFEYSRVMQNRGVQRTGIGEIEVKAISDPSQALSGLRAGGLDLIFVSDQDTLTRAANDSTLRQSVCSGFQVVHRASLSIDCSRRDWAARLSYVR